MFYRGNDLAAIRHLLAPPPLLRLSGPPYTVRQQGGLIHNHKVTTQRGYSQASLFFGGDYHLVAFESLYSSIGLLLDYDLHYDFTTTSVQLVTAEISSVISLRLYCEWGKQLQRLAL